MWGEILTTSEVVYCDALVGRLGPVDWLAPLLGRLGHRDSWSYERKPLLFELRFAGSLHADGWVGKYEYSAGVSETTVDFAIPAEQPVWLIELVSVLTSDAVKEVTWENGPFFGASLSSDAQDPRHSPAGELLLVQQKIGEKVLGPKGPIKFPAPTAGCFHMILVDARGVGVTGADLLDYKQIAYGPAAFRHSSLPLMQRWRLPDGSTIPVLGLFDRSNTLQKAAALVRQRIHFIGFCADDSYADGSLVTEFYGMANQHLFSSLEHARLAWQSFPLPVARQNVRWFAG